MFYPCENGTLTFIDPDFGVEQQIPIAGLNIEVDECCCECSNIALLPEITIEFTLDPAMQRELLRNCPYVGDDVDVEEESEIDTVLADDTVQE